ncbi:MAG: DUF2029 domain-containing protein [Candidatus Nanopelagicales bacterium]|nr:DUF2029 domain-containing protein [Candidatus Nanopelagicales bacterium]MCF8557892.1 DUF2029 domain-containing protein [Candidatus Nanopelagicales bacterium]
MDLSVTLARATDSRACLRARNAALFVFAFAAIVSVWANGRHGYPVWDFLLSDQGSFDDFFMDRDEELADYFMGDPRYGALPPIAMLLGRAYGHIPQDAALVLFICLLTSSIAVVTLLVTRRLSSLALLLLAFPLWFAIFRGNNDIYLFLVILAFAGLLAAGKYGLAALLVGVATAFEPITILLAIPVLVRLRWREIGLLGLGAALAWLTPVVAGPRDLGEYVDVAGQGLSNYTADMAAGDGGLLFGNSLWGGIKIFAWGPLGVAGPEDGLMTAWTLFPYYRILGGAVVLLLVWVVLRRERGIAANVLALTIGMVLVPDVSATYKMVAVLAALIFYIYRSQRPDFFVVSLVALALAPKAFYSGELVSGGLFTLDSALNPLLLTAALLLIAFRQVRDGSGTPDTSSAGVVLL